MWAQFFAQDFHFAVNLFAALVFLAMGWLHFDAWMGHHARKEFLKWVGFGVLALSFLVQSTLIEQSVLGTAVLGDLTDGLIVGFRAIGYVFIIVGQIIDPLQKIPKNEGLKLVQEESRAKSSSQGPDAVPSTQTVISASAPEKGAGPATSTKTPSVLSAVGFSAKWALPVGGIVVAGLYWRRATTGLERHLKRVAYGFALVALSDLIGLAGLLRNTDNPVVYSWVAAFGWVWMAGQIALLVGVLLLGIWVWSYLTKRFFSQLFMVFIASTVVVFFVVTVSVTALMLRNIRSDSLTNLGTAANVLNYAIGAKQAETMAGAEQLAASADIIQAVQAKDHAKLAKLTQTYLSDKRQTSLIITGQSGQVLLKGQDTEQWGESISSDTLVKRALLGESKSSITSYQGVSAPTLQARSAVPIRTASGVIIGSVVTGLELGSAFVDGIRQATGLQSSIYSGDTVAATTLTASDGITRNVNVKLANKAVSKQVLTEGRTYNGAISIENRELLGAFLPLKDADNAIPGMILISQQQSLTLKTAGKSIELTFLLTAASFIVSIVPIYFTTKAIEKQLE